MSTTIPGDELSSDASSQHSPLTSAKSHKKNFSIDLSLELEHQLNAELLDNEAGEEQNKDALDPHILASLVSQLRFSLSEMTKERDELVQILAKSQETEATLSDALQDMTDKATSMKEELTEAQQKLKDDEDAIAMLRTKVEESRRGLMRLQTENRRQSIQPIDLSRASMASISGAPTSMSSKRASFAPMTGSGISSPGSQSISLPDPSSPTPKSRHSRRISGIFGGLGTSPPTSDADPELAAVRKELAALKAALEDTRNELTESQEARDASEMCVKALREFIDENNVGVNPPAASRASSESFTSTKQPAASWGFNKLWKVDTSVASSSNPSASEATPTGPTAEPLSRKFTGLFSSRTNSISSAPMASRTSSSSDVSSVAEPLSPTPGAGEMYNNVVVRELSDTISTISVGEVAPVQKV